MKLTPRPPPRRRAAHLTEEYLAYLASPQWAATRQAALARAGFRCQQLGCRETTRLEVHHRTYETFGAEAWGDLQVFCRQHHRDADRRRQGARRHR